MSYNQIDHKDYIESVKTKATVCHMELSEDINNEVIERDIIVFRDDDRGIRREIYSGSLQGVEGFLKGYQYVYRKIIGVL